MNRASHPGLRPHRFHIPRALARVAMPAVLLACCGCSALQSVQAPGVAYVAADRATYEALAPEYAAYVAADPALADDERTRRTRTLQTWRLRIEAAEQASDAMAPTSQPFPPTIAQ